MSEGTMDASAWMNSIDVAVTVCDREGIIVLMNDQAVRTFSAAGGKTLLGKFIWDWHHGNGRQQ
jgi:PAS domain-containing protein